MYNTNALHKELQGLGHIFKSEMETEVISKLIGNYKYSDRISIWEATAQGLKWCTGIWGICIMCSDNPGKLVVAACLRSRLYVVIGGQAFLSFRIMNNVSITNMLYDFSPLKEHSKQYQ